MNLLTRSDGIDINVGAKARLAVHRGDTISINTPGEWACVLEQLCSSNLNQFAAKFDENVNNCSSVCLLTLCVAGGAGYGGLRRLFQKPPPAFVDAPVPVSGGSLQAFRDNQHSV